MITHREVSLYVFILWLTNWRKEAATNNDTNKCYSRIPKSTVKIELSESRVKKVANGMGLYEKRRNYKIIFF